MIGKESKDTKRSRVHSRIRKKLQGTGERPRLNVYRSTNHLYCQIIDDLKGATIVSANTLEFGEAKEGKRPTGGNVSAARQLGKSIAERAKEKGIKQVVFDRGGYLYHGRIKALAEAAREGGLEF
jgi:large subunit ribosomal protein L18